ncbi:MAG: 3'-5' exonuclease [Candidatus Eisenbacteria bacterium]|nr:3'-5' exonuclease [Candidatus Eisenbacteria bacterium]
MFFARKSPAWDAVTYWALDLETSGLDPARHEILSAGMVPVREGVVRWGERWESLVRPEDPGAVSAEGLRAHHILPGELEHAPALAQVLPEIDRRLQEGVPLLHFGALDLGFLRAAYRAHGMPWPKLRAVDTVELLQKLDHRRHQLTPHPTPTRTALPEAREELGLPAYANHHALTDALATAELFLVLRARLSARAVADLY